MKYKYLPIQLTEFYFIGITTLNAIVTCLSSNMFFLNNIIVMANIYIVLDLYASCF